MIKKPIGYGAAALSVAGSLGTAAYLLTQHWLNPKPFETDYERPDRVEGEDTPENSGATPEFTTDGERMPLQDLLADTVGNNDGKTSKFELEFLENIFDKDHSLFMAVTTPHDDTYRIVEEYSLHPGLQGILREMNHDVKPMRYNPSDRDGEPIYITQKYDYDSHKNNTIADDVKVLEVGRDGEVRSTYQIKTVGIFLNSNDYLLLLDVEEAPEKYRITEEEILQRGIMSDKMLGKGYHPVVVDVWEKTETLEPNPTKTMDERVSQRN